MGYCLLAVHFLEEPDLVDAFGSKYEKYQRAVPMYCPFLPHGSSGVPTGSPKKGSPSKGKK